MTQLDQVAETGATSCRKWPPETELIAAAKNNERVSMESVLVATYPKAAGYFLAKGCSRDQASDLAAEVLTRVAEQLSELRNPTAYRTWVWKLAGSVFRDWIRSESKLSKVRSRSIKAIQPGPEELYELSEEQRLVRRTFEELSDDEQECLWMRYVEQLSFKAIAQIRGSTEGATRVATHRAKKRLTRSVEEGLGASASHC